MSHSVDVQDPRVDAVRRAQAAWRREVSDLGGRNSLLWYRDLPTGTFDLTVAHPGGVAKLLAGGTTRLSELVREQVAYAEARRRVAAIRSRVAELEREHGMSTGFIAVGMATWSMRRAPVPPRAPVLLRECLVRPTDASHADFTLVLGEDVLFNPVLAHYLRDELGLPVDAAELAALSTAGAAFDPRPTYDALEELCAGLDGFGIGPQMVISTFPWAKLPLVASLSGDADGLARSALVSALAGAEVELPSVAAPEDLAPEDDPSVLDSDRSQRAVIAAVRAGASLVVDGGPGTGRTQTAANLVAECLGRGGRVLVVAEHGPALTDLRRRLADVGLDHLVLHLRETPGGAREALAQLQESLRGVEEGEPEEVAEGTDDLHRARVELARHEATMHRRHQPWGYSLADTEVALSRLVALPRPPVSHVRLSGPALEQLVPERLDEVRSALVEAARMGAWLRGRAEDPWYAARIADDEDARRAEAIVQHMVGGELSRAREEMDALCDAAGLPRPVTLRQWGDFLELMERVHATLDVFQPQVYDAPLDELAAALDRSAEDRPSAVTRARARRQVRALLRPGAPPPDLAERVAAARDERRAWEGLAGRAARPAVVPGWQEAADTFETLGEELGWLGKVLRDTPGAQDLETLHLDDLLERLLRLDARVDRLAVAAQAHGVLEPLRSAGLAPLVDDLARRGVAPEDVPAEVDLVFWASLLDHILADYEGPGHDGEAVRSAVDRFADADRRHLAGNAARVRGAAGRAAAEAARELVAQTVALREAVAVAPATARDVLTPVADLAQALRPCWTASPLVVPSTVPAGVTFDLVVVEEASRVPLAHAVSALALGDQVVALGCSTDPAPRPFLTVVDERAEEALEPTGAPTVLAALAGHLPVRRLDTCYRVIDQRLVLGLGDSVHPGPVHSFPGVLRTRRAGFVEAPDWGAVVEQTVELVLKHAQATPWMSLAVATADRTALEELETALRHRIAEARLGRAFREDAPEGLLLTTADRLATEVRDRVLLALGSGALPGTSELGHAVAAARRAVTVVADAAPASWPAPDVAGLLQRVLEVGAAGLPRDPDPREEGHPLLEDLARRLRAEGLGVRLGYGVGRHRLELAVDDPQEPGRPLVAVRTDARAGTLEDRDGIRLEAEQLARLGWTPMRVWCTDLFRDPAREVARIVAVAREASAARARR